MKTTARMLVVLLTPFFASQVGCQMLSQRQANPVAETLGSVTTGGSLAVAQRLDIPIQGLRLDEAVQSALRPGALRDGDPRNYAQIAVMLRRLNVNHVFPLLLVQQDVAGSTRLKSGDHVEVIRWGYTDLFDNSSQRDPSPRIHLTGPLAKQPGEYSSDKPLDYIELVKKPGLVEDRYRQLASLFIITRKRGGVVDRYYMLRGDTDVYGEDDDLGLSSAIDSLLTQHIRSADVLEITNPQLVPLFQAGLVQDRVAPRFEEARKRFTALQKRRNTLGQNSVVRGFRSAGEDIQRRFSRIPFPSLSLLR